MKKQNGFISSSSSVTITYTTKYGPDKVDWTKTYLQNSNITDIHDNKTWSTTETLTQNSAITNLSWKTFNSTSYARIEYFLEAVEKLNSPYTSNTNQYMNLANYSSIASNYDIYSGFVDIVITFPTEIRLAGIELINPWINKLANSKEANYWRYLPSNFKIYKVNNSKINENNDSVTYEYDIAKKTSSNENRSLRPIRYDKLDNDNNLIFLGSYNVNWQNRSSYKCFFKYNSLDNASINLKNNSENTGTATWKCKQLVLRITKTKISERYTNDSFDMIDGLTQIEYKIGEYIRANEIKFGSKYLGDEPSVAQCYALTQLENPEISNERTDISGWVFNNSAKRRYDTVKSLKFRCGLEYKLGGIQLLLSPDIFSVSEMKMYNYSNGTNNKVFIGEWDNNLQEIQYYGTGTIKTSPYISISDKNLALISWKHNFNIPPKYLDVQLFARFNLDYDSFYVGDVVTNLVNLDKEPLSIKLTGSEVQVNISKGIGFTNPQTGEFLSFFNGTGVQMERSGNYDAYKAALAVGAEDYILDYGSKVASTITGGFPFDLYFVVKRLF